MVGRRLYRGRRRRRAASLPLAISTRIPLEVFENIIEGMDKSTLTAAAMVCTAWYPQAMSTLYNTIILLDRASFSMLFKQRCASPCVKQLLATTRRLVVRDERKINDDQDHYVDEEEEEELFIRWQVQMPRKRRLSHLSPFIEALLPAFGRAMPGIQVLEMWRLHPYLSSDFYRALLHFNTITSLNLSKCRLDNFSQLHRIVSSFPELADLTLGNVTITQHSFTSRMATIHLQLRSNVRPRRFHITVEDLDVMEAFVDWIVHSRICASVDELSLRCDGANVPPRIMARILGVANPSRKRSMEDSHICDCSDDLMQNPTLRSFRSNLTAIHLEERAASDEWQHIANELRRIFSALANGSHQLEHIGIEILVALNFSTYNAFRAQAVLKKLDLQDLHKTMNQPCFDVLHDVKMETHLFGELDRRKAQVDNIGRKLQGMFRGLLQPWVDRGIADISWEEIA